MMDEEEHLDMDMEGDSADHKHYTSLEVWVHRGFFKKAGTQQEWENSFEKQF